MGKIPFVLLAFTIMAALLLSGCFGQEENNMNINENLTGSVAGTWIGVVTEELHGPEGSFPEGCTIEQSLLLNIKQDGNALSGKVTTILTNITSCDPALTSSMIGTTATANLSGTWSAPVAKISSEDWANLGAADFTGTVSGNNLTGTVVTCHSDDPRCTCQAPDPRCPGGFDENGAPRPGSLETVNWWTGDFTATRVSPG